MDHFNSPPGWPAPPTPDWRPPRGWRPDPAWPPAPSGWKYWLNERGGRSLGPAGLYGSVSRGRLAAGLGVAALVLMGGCTAIAGSADGTADGKAAPSPTVTVERTVPAPIAGAVPTTTVTVTAKPQPAPTVTVSLPRATVTVTAPLARKTTTQPKTTEPTTEPESAYYANCSEARAAGVAPLYTGDPGYSRKLDRDGDGVACE